MTDPMDKEGGRVPAAPGSHPSDHAPAGHGASRFDPSRVDWREVPYLRKTGRYVFFAACGWSLGISAAALSIAIGLSRDVAGTTSAVVALAAFLALREMSKQWDAVLFQQARWLAQPPAPRSPQ